VGSGFAQEFPEDFDRKVLCPRRVSDNASYDSDDSRVLRVEDRVEIQGGRLGRSQRDRFGFRVHTSITTAGRKI
jgi:hypothetical protein